MEFTKQEKDKMTKELIKATNNALIKGNRILKAKGKPIVLKIGVDVDKIKGNTSGEASLEDKKVFYNLDMAILNGREFINTVPIHEVAHIIANELTGDGGHGNTWKNVMTQMGLSPTRLHDFKVHTSSYIHLCPRCLHEDDISQKQYDTIKDSDETYKCSKCGKPMDIRDIIKKEF